MALNRSEPKNHQQFSNKLIMQFAVILSILLPVNRASVAMLRFYFAAEWMFSNKAIMLMRFVLR